MRKYEQNKEYSTNKTTALIYTTHQLLYRRVLCDAPKELEYYSLNDTPMILAMPSPILFPSPFTAGYYAKPKNKIG